jgi:hypothetical protein
MLRRLPSIVLVTFALGCQAGSTSTSTGGQGVGGAAGGSGGTSGTAGSSQGGTSTGGGGSSGSFGTGAGGEGGEGGVINCDPLGPDDDVDGDGFTPNQGDCEDCDPKRNPNAIEVATAPNGRPFDEDCDGLTDEVEEPVVCDAGIPVDEMDPLAAAAAVDLCKTSAGPNDWGVVSAAWVMADGSPPPASNLAAFHLGHGFLDDFGPNLSVRQGERMLALSSGSARRPEDPGYQNVSGYIKGYTGGFAQGFPKEAAACPGDITGTPYDPTGVEIVVRTPSNATGFSFDFDFYTYEWPGFVCSTYNDFFLAILDPIPEGQTDGNISFDGDLNPISVNNALLEVCGCPENPPLACMAGGKIFNCSLGNIELIGTGFGFDLAGQDHGATGWLRTTAPVAGNDEIRVRFAVHDSGDGSLDSTTLVDNFQWTAQPGTKVGTDPIPQ